MRTTPLLLTASLATCATSIGWAAQNDVVEVLYSEIQTDASSTVPGVPGVFVDLIDRAYVSPSGNHWMLTLSVDTGSTTDDELLIMDGVVVLREGESPSALPAGRALGFIDTKLAVLDSGAFAITADMDGSDADDDIVLARDAMGNWSLIAQQSMQIAGGPAGWLEDSLTTPVITNMGVGYETDFVDGGPPSGMDNLIMLNGAVLLQTQVDAPSGQLSGGAETWDTFDFNYFFASSDSAHYLLQGDLTGPTTEDDVLVKNGVVVLQENYPIPGGPPDVIDSSGISGMYMADNGDWMARGDFDVTNDGWVVHNGVIVAQEGMPIFPGSTEVYDSIFIGQTCNNQGDFAVIGSTDGPTTSDSVIVLNNERVIAREGDPVDLDGNGLFDDDTFYRVFGSDDIVLTDDGRLFLTCQLRNGANVNLQDAFIQITLDGFAGDAFCSPASNNSTGLPTKLSGSFGTGVGSDLHLEATQGPPTQLGYFLVGTGFSDPGIPLGQGNLCLATGGGNSIGRYNVAGGNLNSVGSFDAAGVLQNLVGTSTVGSGYDVPSTVPIGGSPTIMVGQVWHFQVWHREDGGQSNLSNGLSVTF